MIAVLSPAKKLDETPTERSLPTTSLALLDDVEDLLVTTKRLTKPQIQSLMSISDKLTKLNRDRFQALETPFTDENSKPAALLFDGDTYTGFDAKTLSDDELAYAQDHVRILSGLYGLARPLDLIQPYRLEMGTSLSTRRGKNLYAFWGTRITDALNDALEGHDDKTVVRVASDEYFSALQPEGLRGDVVDCTFREERDGELKFISFYAKQARGLLARYMVKHRVANVEGLKPFSYGNYLFRDDLSSDSELVFVRPDSRG